MSTRVDVSAPVELSPSTRLRLLSYNIQVGIASNRPHHYLTYSWKHVLPHAQLYQNLDQIAKLLDGFDIVGLQEVDGGSLRTSFINQTEYLAARADFPFWYHQTNRRIGRIARHANGVLSKFAPTEIADHRLPGLLPGRGAMVLRYGSDEMPLVIVLMHLALSRRARLMQMDYISDVISDYDHVIVMGDLNCQADSPEMQMLFKRTNLREPLEVLHTFPSWRPRRNLDHILVSSTLSVENVKVLNYPFSDHLPVAMDLGLPAAMRLAA